jgi:phosphocarrier protein
MRTFDYTITDEQGIHARPAGELIKVVKGFTSSIQIAKGGKSADCKKIFGVMGLAAKKGDTVTFTFDGDDADAAYDAVSAFMKDNL